MSDNLNPDKSPNLLEKPSTKVGVKKLNKLPLVIVISAAIIVFLSLGYAMYQRGQMNRIKQHNNEKTSRVDGDPNAIVASLLQELRDQKVLHKNGEVHSAEGNTTPPKIQKPQETKDLGKPTDKEINAAVKEKVDELRKLKEKLLFQAVTAPTKLKTQAALNVGPNANPLAQLAALQKLGSGNAQTPGIAMAKALMAAMGSGKNRSNSPVLKNESWMEHAKRSYDYIKSKKTKPLSKYELKAGSIIPGVLITAINSELPGQVLGQVSENVYDTATGKYLLIPQGTKIVGIYNADVTYGQNRIMIAWNRLIFPDGQTLNIGAMNGTDQAGGGGFEDQVDHHYLRIFGSAFLLSVLGGEISIDNRGIHMSSSNQDQQQSETVMQKTAGKMIEKNMDIAPTIKIRSGYKFNIFVTRDMILEPLPYSVYADDYNANPYQPSVFNDNENYAYHPNSPYYSNPSLGRGGSKEVVPPVSPVIPIQ